MSHTTYEVRISGPLPDEVIPELGDVHVAATGVTTVLSGELTDQAALLGLLARLRVLGLDVVEVRRLPAALTEDTFETGPREEPTT